MATGDITPLAKQPAGHRIYAGWRKDRELYVTLQVADSNITLGHWRVRVKA
jgi:hypothetical protein